MRLHLFVETDETDDASVARVRAALPGRNDWVTFVHSSTYGRGLSVNMLDVRPYDGAIEAAYRALQALNDTMAKADERAAAAHADLLGDK